MKYKVALYRVAHQAATIVVEADSEEAAVEYATELEDNVQWEDAGSIFEVVGAEEV